MLNVERDIECEIIPSPRTPLAATHVGVQVRHLPSGIVRRSISLPSQYLNQRAALAKLKTALAQLDGANGARD